MSDGDVQGWHYATRQAVRIRWREGRITHHEPASSEPPQDLWIAPALLDLQVNGYGGIDFQRDGLTAADLLSSVRQLEAAGCTRFLLTLITDEWSRLTARLRHLRELRQQSPELQHAIAGWHVEGPFLSSEPGFHGAHQPGFMLDPTPERVRELRALTGTDPFLLTLAPERSGSLDAIALAVSLGIRVSLGHTNASAELLKRAVAAGATAFTHLGNACPKELDRHDNILWRVFETAGLTVGVIADGIHVSPPLFRLLHRALPADAIYYTTDAMAAAGAGPGRYTIGSLEVEVGPDQMVRQPGKTNFAGSALRPIDGVFRAAHMLGGRWQESWDAFSVRTAQALGLPSGLAVGQPADLCLVRTSPGHELDRCTVVADGGARGQGPARPLSGFDDALIGAQKVG